MSYTLWRTWSRVCLSEGAVQEGPRVLCWISGGLGKRLAAVKLQECMIGGLRSADEGHVIGPANPCGSNPVAGGDSVGGYREVSRGFYCPSIASRALEQVKESGELRENRGSRSIESWRVPPAITTAAANGEVENAEKDGVSKISKSLYYLFMHCTWNCISATPLIN